MAQIRRLIVCTLAFLCPAVAAAGDVPIIDAHSQVDHEVELADVIRVMKKGGISRIILSVRGRMKPAKIAAFAARHLDKITLAVRTKARFYVENKPKYYKMLNKQLAMPEFKAMAEVILYHAQKGSKAPEWIVPISSPQVRAALKAALERKWPFIPHIEFAAAFPRERKRFMADLEAMLRAHPDHPFLLIHMAQLDTEEAGRLIEAHPNVYFMTSHSNTLMVSKSAQPWTNLFDGAELAPDWRKLILKHPDRFILAFDNVFAEHWGDYYLEQIALWRKTLKTLPAAVAHAIAHRNAERLWRLPPVE
ncbi:MAG: amidohydrolase family protein [Alphaproteobacteria bacterium]|jgi:predicted TIM-barrel fold metal-dependent hydrolase|nr:amidohydrolase family protein [Alphaproteobacteria bacterium]